MASVVEVARYLSHWRTALTLVLFILYALLLQYVIDTGVHNRRRIETQARLAQSMIIGIDADQWDAHVDSPATGVVATAQDDKHTPSPHLWSTVGPVWSLATVHLTQADVCGSEAISDITTPTVHTRSAGTNATNLTAALMYKLQLYASEADVLLLTYPEQLLSVDVINTTRCLSMQWLRRQVPLYVADTLILWRRPRFALIRSHSSSHSKQSVPQPLHIDELGECEARHYTFPNPMHARWLPRRRATFSTRLVHVNAIECLRGRRDEGGGASRGGATALTTTTAAHASRDTTERAVATVVLLDHLSPRSKSLPWLVDSQLVTTLTATLTELYPAKWTLLLVPASSGACGEGALGSYNVLHNLSFSAALQYACLADNSVSDVLVGLRQMVVLDR